MGKNICPLCGHGTTSDEDGCCGQCGAYLVTPEVATAIDDDLAREIVERLRGHAGYDDRKHDRDYDSRGV